MCGGLRSYKIKNMNPIKTTEINQNERLWRHVFVPSLRIIGKEVTLLGNHMRYVKGPAEIIHLPILLAPYLMETMPRRWEHPQLPFHIPIYLGTPSSCLPCEEGMVLPSI